MLFTSTRSSSQAAPKPLLSCSICSLTSSPRSMASMTNLSVRLRSNKSRPFCCSCLLPVSPWVPYRMMKTLASVPAPRTSPVTTITSYLTVPKSKTTAHSLRQASSPRVKVKCGARVKVKHDAIVKVKYDIRVKAKYNKSVISEYL
ncbi:hypothetical protein NP493_3g06031 [Ridgeia piscesae]|uniref:Uncharacterized protein n=1 Tax=Ridgeia piscesae TaxID=27915 RepID=A0AAD9ULR0_RIDPI|nr:hypothetical protein NP493_3g06031 [Ridgeia piscesae]